MPRNQARKRNKDKQPERTVDINGQLPGSSGSGESSGTAVNAGDEITRLEEVEKELQKELEIEEQGREVRDWAVGVAGGKDKGM